MNAIPTIQLTITPDAAVRVAELGMEAELAQMLEKARQTIPGLTRLRVVVLPPYDSGIDVSIGIEASSDEVWGTDDTTRVRWHRWRIAAFPPEVWSCFTLLLHPNINDAS
jgi:hypothetical protein